MRLVNRLLAALLALGLATIGVLVVIEVIAERLDKPPAVVSWHRLYHWGENTSLTQGSVRVACIVTAALGLALLFAELKRGRPKRLAVASSSVDAGYTRRGVATALSQAVNDVDGLNKAAVTVRRRRIRIRARTSGIEPYTANSLRGPATEAAQVRLKDLELKRQPRLNVRVSTRRR
ncbi:MAG TPA: DUF6286 domain-containing protein [Mycobacterium sp.]|jgi:hypothetical protein|nr:DUF6286 domain-containing protein [Mycobacterium sp.]